MVAHLPPPVIFQPATSDCQLYVGGPPCRLDLVPPPALSVKKKLLINIKGGTEGARALLDGPMQVRQKPIGKGQTSAPPIRVKDQYRMRKRPNIILPVPSRGVYGGRGLQL